MPRAILLAASLIASAALVTGCATEDGTSTPETARSAGGGSPVASGEAAAYPASYLDLDLPVLPGGVVTSAGRQSTSLRDGISIRLTTDKSVAEARTFYQDHMASLGWTAAPSGPGAAALDLPVANVTFTRDRLTFRATVTAAESGSLVALTVVEN